jgi:hypothetical protein
MGVTYFIMETLPPLEQVELRSGSDTCYHSALSPQLATVCSQRCIRIWAGNLVRLKFALPYTYKIHAAFFFAGDQGARLLVRFLLPSPASPSPPAPPLPSPPEPFRFCEPLVPHLPSSVG